MWTKVFAHTGSDFSGIEAARAWLSANGFSFGFMQDTAPIGVMRGDYSISKWRNLRPREQAELHGTLEQDGRGFRAGDAILKLQEAFVPASEREAAA